ncbi:hypothetical protein BH23ACT12_BH23ACT12_12410 [soil metagenome]
MAFTSNIAGQLAQPLLAPLPAGEPFYADPVAPEPSYSEPDMPPVATEHGAAEPDPADPTDRI